VGQTDSLNKRRQAQNCVVFLKNLSFKAREDEILELFKHLSVEKLEICRNSNMMPLGFAYVEFTNYASTQAALDMNHGEIKGREFQIVKSDRKITFRK